MGRAEEYNAIAETIVSLYEQNATDMSDEVMKLPSSHYTDPERWQREIDLVFKRVPLMMGLSLELPEPGDYKALEMVGVPVLLARQKDRSVRAFVNACRHRGAHVCAMGHGNRSRFTCRYHGWTFANDGRLIGVADAHKFGNIDKSAYGLVELPCVERAGLIFARLTPGEPIDIDDWLGGMSAELEHFQLDRVYFHGTRELSGPNWKIAYDGYLEGYHIGSLHPQTINTVTISDLMSFKAFGPHLRVAYCSPNIKELYDIPRDQWWTREENGYSFVRTLFPNISIYVGLGTGQIAQIIPGPTPDRNRTVMYYIRPEPPTDETERQEIDQQVNFLVDVVDGEDYETGLQIQRGLEARPFDHVLLGRNERGNQYFHRWLDWYLAEDETASKPVL